MLTHSDSVAKIGAALAKVAAKIENPHKNAVNPHFKNRYSDLAEVIGTSRSLLAEHGVSVLQCPGMDDLGRVTLDSMLLHESGEWIKGTASSPIPKADPQGVGSATTYLRRYSLAALLGLAQEDDDGETASQTRNPVDGQKHAPSPVRALAGEEPKGAVPASQRTNGGEPLDSTVPFGKYKGRTWRSLIETDKNYVLWAVEKMDKLDFTVKDALHAAVHAPKATVPLSEPEPDGMDF